jgi:hypothetical protein
MKREFQLDGETSMLVQEDWYSMILFPLQVPGGPELLIIFLILFIAFGLIGRWVYRDARSRGSD